MYVILMTSLPVNFYDYCSFPTCLGYCEFPAEPLICLVYIVTSFNRQKISCNTITVATLTSWHATITANHIWCAESYAVAVWYGAGWLIEHGFTSVPTQYRLYGRRILQVWWPNQQCQSTEGGWLVIQTGLSLTMLTSPCYNNTACMQI